MLVLDHGTLPTCIHAVVHGLSKKEGLSEPSEGSAGARARPPATLINEDATR